MTDINEGPLISIIMPAYNTPRTIAASIFSIIDQSYRNWELIIVEDGSTLPSATEVALFGDRRIKYHRLEKNGGIARALNEGLARASGRFIARMDADDIMEPWRLKDQLMFMLETGVAILGTGAKKFGGESGEILPQQSGNEIINSILVNNPFIHPTVMFDRHALGSELRYNEDFGCEEDYELWSRIVTPSNCANLSHSTLRYRVSIGSNANHLHKKRLTRVVLEKLAARLGIADSVPVGALSEMQVSSFISEPAYTEMAKYARAAEARGLPRLGWLQDALLNQRGYSDFMGWYTNARSLTAIRY